MRYIVHCFVLNGSYQGYLVISLYTLYKQQKLQAEKERKLG